MSVPQTTTSPLELLVRLRWLATAAQAITIAVVVLGWQIDLPLPQLLGLLTVTALTNLVVPRLTFRNSAVLIGSVLVFDAVVLTGLLALTGGPANPFSILYLTHVTLAAIIAGPLWTWAVTTVSSLGYGALFFASLPLPPELGGGHGHSGASYSVHLQGMWLAYTVAAITIAASVSRLAERLRIEREERSRAAHLLGLATLAAGAAHEIGNPLGTIRLAASELEEELGDGSSEQALADVRLINEEVGRAHRVLERMAAGAGELAGEAPAVTDVESLLRATIQTLGAQADRVELSVDGATPPVRWPVQATTQAFLQLLRNGVQASGDEGLVSCRAAPNDGGVRITVEDTGAGMSEDVVARLGEPFFTTRPDGMGLGVFIARSLVEHLGGQLRFQSNSGHGTAVEIWLPIGVPQ